MSSSIKWPVRSAALVLAATVATAGRADEVAELKRQLEQAQQSIRLMQQRLQALEARQGLATTPVPGQSAAVVAVPPPAKEKDADRSFEVYGFAQLDYVQDFKRVNPAWDDTLRPSRIPTTQGEFGGDKQAVLSVRQSRLGVQAKLPVAGRTLTTKFEFDMFGVGGDEGQTTIRLRHAYGEWGQFLAGQTHSLFMDIDVFPNTIDYWGPAGMVFLRNPQIRWTPVTGDFSFAVAIEKPGNDIDAGDLREVDPSLAPGATVQGDEEVPDLTAQLRFEQDWGHVQLAGILRRVGYETIGTPSNRPEGEETGWGLDLSSNFKIGKDKLILAAVYGEGIASYMNDGGVDLAGDGGVGDITAEVVPLLGVVAYYDHYWSERWSSSIGYSFTRVDNQALQSADAFEKGEYASVNLLYTPVKSVLMGAEYLWGKRTDNDGDTGNDSRLQMSLKYSFSSLDFQ